MSPLLILVYAGIAALLCWLGHKLASLAPEPARTIIFVVVVILLLLWFLRAVGIAIPGL